MAARLRLLRRAALAPASVAAAEVSGRTIPVGGLLSGAARNEAQVGYSNSIAQYYRLRSVFPSLVRPSAVGYSNSIAQYYRLRSVFPSLVRPSAAYSTAASNQNLNKERKEISAAEQDPYNDITYNIPEKPVTFTEGASYSLVILVGLGLAAVAGYGVFKELIFEPKEYKIFGQALKRIQNDSQVKSLIGTPVTGYGQESKNRAARQRIANKVWKDEEGVEHVAVNFYIRGPNGAGKVYAEMFKDSSDRSWKFMSLIVETTAPTKKQMLLESYIPA